MHTPETAEYNAFQALASGAKTYDFGDAFRTPQRFAARRARHFIETWRHILDTGEHRVGLKASPGLLVTETATKQNGGIVFVENPSDTAVSGYVPPFLPDVSLAPRTVFAYVHDAPIGELVPGGKFLASYVGLVKSDAMILAAHIRPAPFEGARVYVYGEPGESREIVLFHGSERGQSVTVTFADAPRVYTVSPSQVVALSTSHAGRTFFATGNDHAPVLIGADDVTEQSEECATLLLAAGASCLLFALATSGAITEIVASAPAASPETGLELPAVVTQPGWYDAIITTDDALVGSLVFESVAPVLSVRVNGAMVSPSAPATFPVELVAGQNTVAAQFGVGAVTVATLCADGACFLINVAEWHGSLVVALQVAVV